MDKYDLFARALHNAYLGLTESDNYLNNQKSNNTVKTFEDCAKVEKDINDRLEKAYFNSPRFRR